MSEYSPVTLLSGGWRLGILGSCLRMALGSMLGTQPRMLTCEGMSRWREQSRDCAVTGGLDSPRQALRLG